MITTLTVLARATAANTLARAYAVLPLPVLDLSDSSGWFEEDELL